MSGQGTDQPPGALPSLNQPDDDEGDGATEFYNPDGMVSANPYQAPAPPPGGAKGGAHGDLGNLSSTVAMDIDAAEMMRQAVLRQAEEDDQTSRMPQPGSPPLGSPPAGSAGPEAENFGATAMLDPEQMASLQAGLEGLGSSDDVSGTAMLDPNEVAAMRAQAGLGPGQIAPAAPPNANEPVSPFLSQGIQPAQPEPPKRSKLPWILVGVAILLGAAGAAAAFLL